MLAVPVVVGTTDVAATAVVVEAATVVVVCRVVVTVMVRVPPTPRPATMTAMPTTTSPLANNNH